MTVKKAQKPKKILSSKKVCNELLFIKDRQDKDLQIILENLKQKSRDKKLCVLVSCKGVSSILKLNLEALKKQSLAPEFWFPVFLFWEKTGIKNSESSFLSKASPFLGIKDQPLFLLIQEYFPDSPVLLLPKEKASYELRNLAFDYLNSPLFYFLDEDVLLKDSEHLAKLLRLHREHPEEMAIGGSYLSVPACTFWGQIYNWLVRLWMNRHQSLGMDFLPAGNLSVKTPRLKQQGLSARFYSPVNEGFGGEEIFFLKSIHKKGGKSLWIKELDTYHIAQHGFKDWLNRAWIHGKSLSFGGSDSQKLLSKDMALKFFNQPGPFKIKLFALFYLLLTRISCFLTAKKRNRA